MSWNENILGKQKFFIVITSMLLACVIACVLMAARYELLRLRISFADDQVSIFYAALSSADKTTDPRKLAAQLDYVVNYYPSGSKQVAGTHLDRIVEIARTNATSGIINRLRIVTGRDLGGQPNDWCKEYSPQSGQTILLSN